MKCKCCGKTRVMKPDAMKRRNWLCSYCYNNCPSHRVWCNKKKGSFGIIHKFKIRYFWGNGTATCNDFVVSPRRGSWFWKEVTCKNCLKMSESGLRK